VNWVEDYFGWIFSLGAAGMIVMLVVTGAAALLALGVVGNAIIWTMVGVKRALGGDVSGRTKAERESAA